MLRVKVGQSSKGRRRKASRSKRKMILSGKKTFLSSSSVTCCNRDHLYLSISIGRTYAPPVPPPFPSHLTERDTSQQVNSKCSSKMPRKTRTGIPGKVWLNHTMAFRDFLLLYLKYKRKIKAENVIQFSIRVRIKLYSIVAIQTIFELHPGRREMLVFLGKKFTLRRTEKKCVRSLLLLKKNPM